jgi:hypothetical protein
MGMQRSPMFLWILLIGLGAVRCADGEFAEACLGLCRSLNCGDGVDVGACKDDLVDRADAADGVGEACGNNYREMIVCAQAIDGCSGTANWEDGRGLDLDYDCKAETEAFLDACGELWFPDRRGG